MKQKLKFEPFLWLAYITAIIVTAVLMQSCSTTKHSTYQQHLRSTHHNNWVKQDNGGCAWSN